MMPREKPAHVLARMNGAPKAPKYDTPGYPGTPEHTASVKNNGQGQKGVKKPMRERAFGTKRLQSGTVIAKTMSEAKWRKVLEMTASGLLRPDVINGADVTRETFDAYLISNVAASKQLREAQLIAIRVKWPMEELEAMFSAISTGKTVKAAALERKYDQSKLQSFYELVTKDRIIKEMYNDARELQAESWLDDIVDISDNRGEDTYTDYKGNVRTDHGVVQRDKLRVDVRQWGMGALNRKRFGDYKHVDHGGEIAVNHAVLLANARKRVEGIKKPVTIDNETQQAVGE